MLSDKFNKMKEEAHIGQEMLDSSLLSETDRKCVTIRQTIKDGDFTLEEALSLYNVSRSDYYNFIASELVEHFCQAIVELGSVRNKTKIEVVCTIEIFTEFYKAVLQHYDKDAPQILAHFDTLSKDINEGKIAV
jgi:hypothetical protein